MAAIYNGYLLMPTLAILEPKLFLIDNLGNPTDTRIISISNIGYDFPIIYFGNTITIAEREGLMVPLGNMKSPSSPLALITGYTYVFYVMEKTFVVTDSFGTSTIRQNIYSWGDLDIEFGVYESNQFRMVLTGSPSSASLFVFATTISTKYTCNLDSFMWGEFDRYITSILHWRLPLGELYKDTDLLDSLDLTGIITFNDIFKLIITDVSRLAYTTLYPNILKYNDFNIAEFVRANVKYQGIIADASLKILLALVTNLIYPSVLPVQNVGETQNNRPVYEPWMIMYILNFLLYNIPINNGDPPYGPRPDADNNPYVFSLSPSW